MSTSCGRASSSTDTYVSSRSVVTLKACTSASRPAGNTSSNFMSLSLSPAKKGATYCLFTTRQTARSFPSSTPGAALSTHFSASLTFTFCFLPASKSAPPLRHRTAPFGPNGRSSSPPSATLPYTTYTSPAFSRSTSTSKFSTSPSSRSNRYHPSPASVKTERSRSAGVRFLYFTFTRLTPCTAPPAGCTYTYITEPYATSAPELTSTPPLATLHPPAHTFSSDTLSISGA